MKHIILAVSYRAEMLENEMKEQETKVRAGGRRKSRGWGRGGGGWVGWGMCGHIHGRSRRTVFKIEYFYTTSLSFKE